MVAKKPSVKFIKIPIKVISIEDDGCHLMIEVKINGKKANMIIDTGASKTVFDLTQIKKFITRSKNNFKLTDKLSTGLGTNNLESHKTTITKLEIGDLVIKNYEAFILDMKHVTMSYEKLNLPTVDGVLGGDLLTDLKAVINYNNKTLKIKNSSGM